MMKKTLLLVAGFAVMAAGAAVAQERTAGGTLDTQMTWSTLSNQVKTTQAYAEGLNSRLVQVETCGRKGMVYAPGASGVDGDGCLTAKNLDKVLECGRENKVYSTTAKDCVEVAGGSRWYLLKIGPSTGGQLFFTGKDPILKLLKNAGYDECTPADKMTIGRKCAVQGRECGTVASRDESCGSQGDSTCRRWTSQIYRCD